MIRAWHRPPDHGWWMIWTLAITETVSWGILCGAFSVFIIPMQQDLGWSTPEITGAYSLALVVAVLELPPIGRWLDRAGPRWSTPLWQQTQLDGGGHGFATALYAELAVDAEGMPLDGAGSDKELGGDLLVAVALTEQREDLQFAHRQGFDQA
jgi:hypothetical protein